MEDLRITLFTILVFTAIAGALASSPVADTDGEPLQRGVEYYIRFISAAGRLTLNEISVARPCPYGVVIRPFSTPNLSDYTVSFHPADPITGIIEESSDTYINVRNASVPKCADDSYLWNIDTLDSSDSNLVVKVGGRVGDSSSIFKIERVRRFNRYYVYKFVSCSPASHCRTVVGLNLGRWFHWALVEQAEETNHPYEVLIRKVVPKRPWAVALQSVKPSPGHGFM